MPSQPNQSIVVPHVSGFQGADGQSLMRALKQVQLFQAQSMTYGRQMPWNQPWGYITSATATSNQTGISSIADLTSLSVTWTAVANRRYKIEIAIPMFQNSGAAGTQNVVIATSGGTTIATWQQQVSASFDAMANVYTYVTPAAGSVTYKARASTSASTCQTSVSATIPALISVEDVGPTGLRPAS